MKIILRSLPVILAGFLLLALFQRVNSIAHAEQPLPTQPAPPFLELVPSSVSGKSFLPSTPLAPTAITADPVLMNVFAAGDELIHGLVYYNGFIYGSTRYTNPDNPEPARILKIDPNTLTVVGRATLTGLQDAEDIEAANGYLWAITYMYPAQLVRIDPATMAWASVITFNTPYFLSYGTAVDYAFGYIWAAGLDTIVQVDISQPLTPTLHLRTDYSGLAINDAILFHALTHDTTHMWTAGYQFNALPLPDGAYTADTYVRFDPLNPTTAYTPTTVTPLFPDDMAYLGSHLYSSSEAVAPSDLFEFANDVTTYTSTHVANTGSYGTFAYPMDPGSFYSVYTNTAGTPGTVIKFDLNLNNLISFYLPAGFGDASEMVFDPAGNMYVVTWQIPTHIVKYSSPAVTNLAVTNSGGHSLLRWTHMGTVVDHYEVWASTQPYFNPGDVGSTKLGDVSGPFTTTVSSLDPTATIGDPNTNRFYVVRSVSTAGLLSAISNRVGEMDYAVVRDRYNTLGIPLINSSLLTADNLGNAVGAIQVSRWVTTTQTFATRSVGISGSNFNLVVGLAYFVYTPGAGPTVFSIQGSVPASGSVGFGFSRGAIGACRLNLITLPLDQSAIIRADALATAIGGVPIISEWIPGTSSFRSRTVGISGSNFTTKMGYPYWPCADTSGGGPRWPQ